MTEQKDKLDQFTEEMNEVIKKYKPNAFMILVSFDSEKPGVNDEGGKVYFELDHLVRSLYHFMEIQPTLRNAIAKIAADMKLKLIDPEASIRVVETEIRVKEGKLKN